LYDYKFSDPDHQLTVELKKYIKMVQQFRQDMPDGVTFTPQRPELFDYKQTLDLEKDNTFTLRSG
jgi:hypothetical protein